MPKIATKKSPVTGQTQEASTVAISAANPQQSQSTGTQLAVLEPSTELVKKYSVIGSKVLDTYFANVETEKEIAELQETVKAKRGEAMNMLTTAIFDMVKAEPTAAAFAQASFKSSKGEMSSINDYFKAGLGFVVKKDGKWIESEQFQIKFKRIKMVKGKAIEITKDGDAKAFNDGVNLRSNFVTQMKEAMQGAVSLFAIKGIEGASINPTTKQITVNLNPEGEKIYGQGEFDLVTSGGRQAKEENVQKTASGIVIPSLVKLRDAAKETFGSAKKKQVTKPEGTTREQTAATPHKADEISGNVDLALRESANHFLAALNGAKGMTVQPETIRLLGTIFNTIKPWLPILNSPAVRQAQAQAQAKPQAQTQAAKHNEPKVSGKASADKQ